MLDGIAQLAHVARPAVLLQDRQRHRRKLLDRLLIQISKPLQVVTGQTFDVVRAVAQRRDLHLGHVQPIVQVLAKRSLLDHRRQIAVGGHDHAHVDGHGLDAAQRHHGALLHTAQQHGLDRQRHLPDLVEEQRSAVGRPHETERILMGAGESAFDVTEQLRLRQRVPQRCAVDRHEGSAGAIAGGVNVTGHQLLARARLALNHDRTAALSHRFDL